MSYKQWQWCVIKVKIYNRYLAKQNWAREKYLIKQMVQSLVQNGTKMVKNSTKMSDVITCLNNFRWVMKSTLKIIF